MHNSATHSVWKVIEIGWSRFQSASNKPPKLCLICRCGLLLLVADLTREPTASPALTKWWKWELMLATNFGNLCQMVTEVGSQNFGYQIWSCTRLVKGLLHHVWLEARPHDASDAIDWVEGKSTGASTPPREVNSHRHRLWNFKLNALVCQASGL